MNPENVTQLVQARFKKSILPEQWFPNEDVTRIEQHFGCLLPEGFAMVRTLMGIYTITGGHMSVDEILKTPELEREVNPLWEGDFIPFNSIGNGDYICFRRRECPNSAIYYVPHDEFEVHILHASFDDYLKDPEWFD